MKHFFKKKRKNPQENAASPMAHAMDMAKFQAGKTDPQGSYTGVPADPAEKPVQDADDL